MPSLSDFDDSTIDVTLNIANTATVSGMVNIKGFLPCSIRPDANFIGTTITFQTSRTGGNDFVARRDNTDTTISVTTAAGHEDSIDFTYLHGIRWLELVSGSTQTNANGSNIVLVLRRA